MRHATLEELRDGLAEVRAAPRDAGSLELIVRRPAPGERELLESGVLDAERGLVGDGWSTRRTRRRDGPNPDMQVTVMSARFAALVARSAEHERWAQAGDQLYVDLDLSEENLPSGTRLEVGEAALEVTAKPHTGCGKFIRRFGADSMKLISSDVGRELRLRGVNTRVVVPGAISRGDAVRRVAG